MTTAPWGVGRYVDETGAVRSVSLSLAEVDGEAAALVPRLRSWGFGPDDVILVIAGVADAVQFAPFQRAARTLGGISCTAEPSAFDARRTASFLEQFPLRAVIGLDGAVLDGLGGLGDPAAILGRCPHLIVRTEAVPRVAALGLATAAVHVLGPAVAVECPARVGGHLGAGAWIVGTEEGRVWVEPAPGRDLSVGRVATGVPGRVVRERCACGSDDPRVVVE